MRDRSGLDAQVDSWVTAGTPSEARSALRGALERHGCKLPEGGGDEQDLAAQAGSRVIYRLLGLLTPTRRVPLRVTARVTAAGDGSLVEVELLGDQGRYLLRVNAVAEQLYAEAFGSLLDALRIAAPPMTSR